MGDAVEDTVDLFHPKFDVIIKELGYLRITYTGEVPQTVHRESGKYEYPDLFGDTVATVGLTVPAGFKFLEVEGTNPEKMRKLIKGIRSGSLQPSECWE